MSRILCLDTTSEFGSIALLEGHRVVEELVMHSPDGFAHIIYGCLETLLAKRDWDCASVDCFAVANGPGSFTGVRVGIATVKGFAEATGTPLVTVSNLRALAWYGSPGLRATLLDARRGEIYAGLYDDALRPVVDEVVLKFPDWLAALPEQQIEFISTDFAPFRPALAGTRFENAKVTKAPRAYASAIGQIAAQEFAAGRAEDPASADANYVRRADAELKWKDR